MLFLVYFSYRLLSSIYFLSASITRCVFTLYALKHQIIILDVGSEVKEL